MSKTKLRAKLQSGITEAIALISHPMTSGLTKKSTDGNRELCHFITEIVALHNEKTIMTTHWSGAIAKNPFIAFRFKGANKGDSVTLKWMDNHGNSDSVSTIVN